MDSAETEVDDAIHEISEHCKSVEKVKLSPVILIRVTPLDDEPDVFVQVCLPSGYGHLPQLRASDLPSFDQAPADQVRMFESLQTLMFSVSPSFAASFQGALQARLLDLAALRANGADSDGDDDGGDDNRPYKSSWRHSFDSDS